MGHDLWGSYITNATVTTRVGSGQPRTSLWALSADNTATFRTFGTVSEGPFLREMAGADKFVAQVTPYNESPITAVFDTTGMREALAPVAQACGWSMDDPVAPEAPRNPAKPAAEKKGGKS